jgi:hypothetical protein
VTSIEEQTLPRVPEETVPAITLPEINPADGLPDLSDGVLDRDGDGRITPNDVFFEDPADPPQEPGLVQTADEFLARTIIRGSSDVFASSMQILVAQDHVTKGGVIVVGELLKTLGIGRDLLLKQFIAFFELVEATSTENFQEKVFHFASSLYAAYAAYADELQNSLRSFTSSKDPGTAGNEFASSLAILGEITERTLNIPSYLADLDSIVFDVDSTSDYSPGQDSFAALGRAFVDGGEFGASIPGSTGNDFAGYGLTRSLENISEILPGSSQFVQETLTVSFEVMAQVSSKSQSSIDGINQELMSKVSEQDKSIADQVEASTGLIVDAGEQAGLLIFGELPELLSNEYKELGDSIFSNSLADAQGSSAIGYLGNVLDPLFGTHEIKSTDFL